VSGGVIGGADVSGAFFLDLPDAQLRPPNKPFFFGVDISATAVVG